MSPLQRCNGLRDALVLCLLRLIVSAVRRSCGSCTGRVLYSALRVGFDGKSHDKQ